MWPATERFGLRTAPSGLALVQDLWNTDAPAGGAGFPDLLADADAATRWARAAVGPDAPALTGTDAEHLRTFRARLRDGEDVRITADVEIGTTALRPVGTGWHHVAAAVLLAVHDAQLTGEWHRLKICRNDACGTAFYDRSRNSSAVWHDAVRCGNAPNLRASRARRRESGTG